MARYFYLWIPYAAVGAIVLLGLPWLGLIALIVVVPVALAALALAVVVAPYLLVQAIAGHLRGAQPVAALAPETRSTSFQPTYGMNLE